MKSSFPIALLHARRRLRQIVAVAKPLIALAAVVAIGIDFAHTRDLEKLAWFLMIARWALD